MFCSILGFVTFFRVEVYVCLQKKHRNMIVSLFLLGGRYFLYVFFMFVSVDLFWVLLKCFGYLRRAPRPPRSAAANAAASAANSGSPSDSFLLLSSWLFIYLYLFVCFACFVLL